MLVLTRKLEQTIVIAGEIEITIVEIRKGQVRIGIKAPAWFSVDRKEVFDRKAAIEDVDNNPTTEGKSS